MHTLWPVYGALLLNGVVRSFNGPAAQSFLPQVVPEEAFPKAVAWASSVQQGAAVLGPLLGGFIYGTSNNPAFGYAGSASCCVVAMTCRHA